MAALKARLNALERKRMLDEFTLFVSDDGISSFACDGYEMQNDNNLTNEEFFTLCDTTMGRRAGYTQKLYDSTEKQEVIGWC